MFVINDCILHQFDMFLKEGGVLPSLTISINNNSNFDILNSLVIDRVIGIYTFYKCDNNKLIFSNDSVYTLLNDNMTDVKVYCKEKSIGSHQTDIANILMRAYMYRLVSTGNMMIHAAAIVYNGSGILFCGVSGAGKSTQANLWKKTLKADVLNYDKPCIIFKNNEIYVHGSPWSGKEELYKNEYAKIKAIVFVNQDKSNRVNRLTCAKAYANIYLHNYFYFHNKELENKYSEIVSTLVSVVPVYDLFCDISEVAVKTLFEELFPDENYTEKRRECQVKYKVKDNFIMRKIADEYIVTPRGSEVFDFNATVVFNETGAFLWERMSEYITVDELAEILSEKYDIEFDNAKSDCLSFIQKMNNNNMLNVL